MLMLYAMKKTGFKRKYLVLLLLCAGMLYANDPGLNAFHKGDFEKARNYYRERRVKEKNNDRIAYNLGTAALAMEDLHEAASFLTESLASENDMQRARAHYNLGQLALQEQKTDAAAGHFKRSMLYDPDDISSKYMYEYLLRLQQQEEQQKDKQDGEGDSDNEGQKADGDTQENGEQQQEKDPGEDQGSADEGSDSNDTPADAAESQLKEEDLTPQELSREQARNILNAMREQEMESMKKLILSKNRDRNIKRGNEW